MQKPCEPLPEQWENDEINRFVNAHAHGHLFQSGLWSLLKGDWISHTLVVRDAHENIVGSMCVRIRRLKGIPFTMMYASRGPVCDWHDAKVLHALTEQAQDLARSYRAISLKLDPAVPQMDETFCEIMHALGYRHNDRLVDLEGVQPRTLMRVDLCGKTEQMAWSRFSQKHRYNTRLAMKRGVTVRVGKRADIPAFYELMKQTGARNGFAIRAQSYFERMYDTLNENDVGILLLAYDAEKRCVAALWGSVFAGQGMYLYGASANHGRSCMATYLLQWEMMRICMQRGVHTYDLRGVPTSLTADHPLGGLYRFKKGFGGMPLTTVGEFDYVYRPFWHVCVYTLVRWHKRWWKWRCRRKHDRQGTHV